MGTITFYQLSRSGTPAQNDQSVAKFDKSLIRTQDASTSTSAESITLAKTTTLLGVNAVELHRISLESDMTNYIPVKASSTAQDEIEWYGVEPGSVVYYRADA